MGIGNRIREARNSLGITQEELAQKLGITKGAVANYENETSHPKEAIMYKLIEALHVDANYLFQDVVNFTFQQNTLSKSEKELIKKYRYLDQYGQKAIDALIDIEIEQYKDFKRQLSEARQYTASDVDSLIHIPYYDLPVSAGTGIFLDSDNYELLDIPDTPASRQATYAVRVNGDSMMPDYQDGDILLVRQQPSLEIGELGIFILNGEGFFKEYGGDCLISLNSVYDDIPIGRNDSVYIKGKVIGKV